MNEKRYIQELISQGEHSQQDFKYKVMDAHKLAKSVSAFANTDGGRLLIGVRDDGHISGVRSEEEIYMMHAAAFEFCKPAVSIKFDTYHVEGKTLVVATIPPSEKRPIFAIDEEGRRRAYIRIADENIVASPVHLVVWREQFSPQGSLMAFNENEKQLMETMAKQPMQTLNQIVRRSHLARHKVSTLLGRFIRYNLVAWHFTDRQFKFTLNE